MKKKHILVTLKIVCGEYEFSSKHLATLNLRRNEWRYALSYAKDFYGACTSTSDDTFYFNGGEIAVSVRGVAQVSAADAEVLARFI